MDRINEIVGGACEETREALKEYYRTGSDAALARIHSERCLTCDRALDAVIALRSETARTAPSSRSYAARLLEAIAIPLSFGAPVLGILGAAYLVGTCGSDGRTANVMRRAAREEARLTYVRMPGYPQVCVATLKDEGRHAPSFAGVARCADVRDRVEFDEGTSFALGRLGIIRIDGTDECLATDHEGIGVFTFPCLD